MNTCFARGGHTTMINSVLSSLPLYMHDVLFCNSNNIGADEIRLLSLRFFFWQNDGQKRKYRLVKWSILCQPKDQGGLGKQLMRLLSKWLFKLLITGGTWQQIIWNKYLGSYGESHFWGSHMNWIFSILGPSQSKPKWDLRRINGC